MFIWLFFKSKKKKKKIINKKMKAYLFPSLSTIVKDTNHFAHKLAFIFIFYFFIFNRRVEKKT
jgi:hypothetical protein